MLNRQQGHNIAKLITDLLKIHSDSDVTPEQIQTLKTDVMTLLDGALDPDTVTKLEKLESDIKTMIDNGQIDISLLKEDLTAIVESIDIKKADKIRVLTDLAGIKEAAHLDGTIETDLQAIVEQAKANHETKGRHV